MINYATILDHPLNSSPNNTIFIYLAEPTYLNKKGEIEISFFEDNKDIDIKRISHIIDNLNEENKTFIEGIFFNNSDIHLMGEKLLLENNHYSKLILSFKNFITEYKLSLLQLIYTKFDEQIFSDDDSVFWESNIFIIQNREISEIKIKLLKYFNKINFVKLNSFESFINHIIQNKKDK